MRAPRRNVMGFARLTAVRAGRAATAVGVCLALAACVTSQSDAGGSGALFKAQIGEISGGVSPGPHSVWYVQRQPVAYVKMGFADPAIFERLFTGNTGNPSEAVLAGWDRARETMTRIAWKPIGYDPQLPALLAGVSARSLVLWGSEDRIVPPRCASQWAEALGSQCTIVPGGHQLDLEAPEALAARVAAFLKAGQTRRPAESSQTVA